MSTREDDLPEVNGADPITEVSKVSLKNQILQMLIPVCSIASSASTMYAAQDIVKQVLTAMGYESNDIASDGQDSDIQASLAIIILANIAIWGIPLSTIGANSVLRYFSELKVADFLKSLMAQNSMKAYLPLLPYLFFAIPTDISDTTINVAMSATLKEEWPSFAIKVESLLSFLFLLPINIYGINTLHDRLKLVYDKYTTGEDKKLLSRRLEAIFYDLKSSSEDDKLEKQNRICTISGINPPGVHLNDDQQARQEVLSYDDIRNLKLAQLKKLAEDYCKTYNLPDGSSWASTVATGISVLFSLSAGAATMRSPYVFYTNTCGFPGPVAWALSTISGVTKAAFYMSSYDNIMWYAKHYNRLFGSAPVIYGIGAVLMAMSAAGFWEVAERALAVAFKTVAEDPTWWYISLESIIFLAGVVANTNGAAALATLKMEENRQNKLKTPDVATAFKERASEVLKISAESRNDEEQPLMGGEVHVGCCSAFSFFGSPEEAPRYSGPLAPLKRVANLAFGFNL
jgi:hypothetical protein